MARRHRPCRMNHYGPRLRRESTKKAAQRAASWKDRQSLKILKIRPALGGRSRIGRRGPGTRSVVIPVAFLEMLQGHHHRDQHSQPDHRKSPIQGGKKDRMAWIIPRYVPRQHAGNATFECRAQKIDAPHGRLLPVDGFRAFLRHISSLDQASWLLKLVIHLANKAPQVNSYCAGHGKIGCGKTIFLSRRRKMLRPATSREKRRAWRIPEDKKGGHEKRGCSLSCPNPFSFKPAVFRP